MKILFLTVGPEVVASSRTRVFRLLPYLHTEGIKTGLITFATRSEAYKIANSLRLGRADKLQGRFFRLFSLLKLLISAGGFDILFIQKILLPRKIIWVITKVLRSSIAFDFDDAIFSAGQKESSVRASRSFGRFAYMVRNSKYVTAGNDFLREAALRFNSNVYVLNTPVDTDRFKTEGNRAKNRINILIGWIGSAESSGYLKDLRRVFDVLLERHKNIGFKFIGADNFFKETTGITVKKWSLEDELEDLRNLDIGIMPLRDDDWARGKCGYKLLQYMAIGIPCVASPVGINNSLINDGINGFLAGSEDEWVAKLEALIKDESLRMRMGSEGRRIAEELYSYSAISSKFIRLLKDNIKEKQVP